MNKTIIININGIVFHIEEDAYEILKQYMTEVKRHFAYTAGSDEIVADIENRIAEMFVERLEQEKKQVIVLQDVELVTAQMGRVSDFELEDEEAPFTSSEAPRSERKLFRDVDDRIIGGVCSGIGHYFDVEAKWIRLIMILFVFLGGSGLLVYAIIWAITPAAKTRTDKMAMKGEQPNLQNFKRNFDEEVEAINSNLKRAHEHARPALSALETGVRDFFSGLASFINAILKGIIKLIGSLIIFAGIIALLALVMATFGVFGWNSELNTFPFNAINPEYKGMIYLAAFILIIIPVLALMFFAIRIVFNKVLLTRTGSFVLLIIWIFGLCIGAYYGTRFGAEFKSDASFSETVPLKPAPVYYLKMTNVRILSHEDSLNYKIEAGTFNDNVVINAPDDDFNPDNNNHVRIYVEKSDVDKPVLVKTFSSQGPDFSSALKFARSIIYTVEQTDSVITFNNRVHIPKGSLWRDQEVRLTLKVPQNTRLVVDDETSWYTRLNVGDCSFESDKWRKRVIMTSEGLKCDTLAYNIVR